MQKTPSLPYSDSCKSVMKSFMITAMAVSALVMSPPLLAQESTWKKPTLRGQALLDTLPATTLTEKMRFFLRAVWPEDKSLKMMSLVVENSFVNTQSVEILFVTMQEYDARVGDTNTAKPLHRSGASCRIKKDERKDGKNNTRDLFLIAIDPDNIESIADLGGTLINEFTTFLEKFCPVMDGKSTFSVSWDKKTIVEMTLSSSDGNALSHNWLLEWVSSIAETVTTARLNDSKGYQEKTYEQLADELIMNMGSWKFRHDDPDGYANDYLAYSIRQFTQADCTLSDSVQKKLSEELLRRVSENRHLMIKYLQNMKAGVEGKK